jgi:hypothetical protein
MTYDWPWEDSYIDNASELLNATGYKKKNIIFYVLHNFYDFYYKKGDTPHDFLSRIQDFR